VAAGRDRGRVPAVAAIAAVAVIVSGALPVRTSGPVAAHGSAAAPHRFNPLIPYASFGWLSAGKRITSAYTSAASEELEVGPTGSPHNWDLMVYTADSCNHTSGQLLELLHGGHRPTLSPGHQAVGLCPAGDRFLPPSARSYPRPSGRCGRPRPLTEPRRFPRRHSPAVSPAPDPPPPGRRRNIPAGDLAEPDRRRAGEYGDRLLWDLRGAVLPSVSR
jgi:hypothetical protein